MKKVIRKEKSPRGITLVALIITIIILLILAGISVNAIVGENGLLERAKESRILTILSDIIFNIENNIIDINTENIIKGKKATATEMLKFLQEKDVLNGDDSDFLLGSSTSLMQSRINDNRLNNLSLSYNGDIWLDNYKRGKIQLSTQKDVLYSEDGKTKIEVIDGTVEEVNDNLVYYLHSLKERDDFVCWINQYGEIISNYEDTLIYIYNSRNEEYTAVYDYNIKEVFNSYNMSFDEYIECLDMGRIDDIKFMIGMQSSITRDEDDDMNIEIQATHNMFSNFYYNENDEISKENGPLPNMGILVDYIYIVISYNYESLISDEDGIPKGCIFENGKVVGEAEDMIEAVYNDELIQIPNFDEEEPDDSLTCFEYGDYGYFPLVESKEKEKYQSVVDFAYGYISKDEEYIQELKNKGITRLYYRAGIGYKVVLPLGVSEEDAENGEFWVVSSDDEIGMYFEPAIKYIDL